MIATAGITGLSWHRSGMARFALALVIGLLVGLLGAWWLLGGKARALAQSGEKLFAWVEVTATEELPVSNGGTPYIISSTLHLRNLGTATAAVAVPAQRFLLVLGDGVAISGQLAEAASVRIGTQETASVPLPKVSFVSRSQDAASLVIALDEGDGLRLVAAPVGEAPAKPAEKPVEKPVEKPAK